VQEPDSDMAILAPVDFRYLGIQKVDDVLLIREVETT
jgi:hypothetical protein